MPASAHRCCCSLNTCGFLSLEKCQPGPQKFSKSEQGKKGQKENQAVQVVLVSWHAGIVAERLAELRAVWICLDLPGFLQCQSAFVMNLFFPKSRL